MYSPRKKVEEKKGIIEISKKFRERETEQRTLHQTSFQRIHCCYIK